MINRMQLMVNHKNITPLIVKAKQLYPILSYKNQLSDIISEKSFNGSARKIRACTLIDSLMLFKSSFFESLLKINE